MTSPRTLNLLRRTIGALADIASAGVGRSLVIGDAPSRITAALTGLEIEPSEVLDVLDPTAVDADLADTLRVPGSIGELVAPWREGARAAVRATGKVTGTMLAAGIGRYELAAGVRIRLEDVRGPDWSAARMAVTTGPIRFAAGPDPSLWCLGIDVVAILDSDDLARGVRHLPVTSIRIEDAAIMIRWDGRFTSLTFGVQPRYQAGRVMLEARTIVWRGVRLPLPALAARRLTRWIDPPPWLEMESLLLGRDTVEVRGRVDRWDHPISLETIQHLATAAQRRGQDLVLPSRPAATGRSAP